MRKINFLSGINAKLVLAAMALGSFVLTGCEEEDFKVNVPDIDINIPAAEDGVVYVNLSATSENGNTLEGVKFTAEDGTEIEASKEYKDAATFTVIASKDGYRTVSKIVNVPKPAPGSFVVMPVNFVLTTMEAVDMVTEEPSGELEATSDLQSFKGTYVKGHTYTEHIAVPSGAFLSDEQRAALLAEIEKLEGPTDTRALTDKEANLATAKGMLRAAVNNIPDRENMQTEKVPVTFIPLGDASVIDFTITTNWLLQEITLTATVAEEYYSVSGEQTLAGKSKISAAGFSITHAHGGDVEIDHGHGHGGSNAGGGEIGK